MENEKKILVFLYNRDLSKCNRDLLENSFYSFNLKFKEYKKKDFMEMFLSKILWNIIIFFLKKIAIYLTSLIMRNNPKLKKNFSYYKIILNQKFIELKERVNPTEEITLRISINSIFIRNSLTKNLKKFYKNINPNAFKEIYTFGKRKKLRLIVWIGVNRFIFSETKKLIHFDDENYKKEEFDNIEIFLEKFLKLKKP